MSKVRKYTNKLIDLAEDNVLDWETIARECLAYMSEDEVADMAEDLLDAYDIPCDDDDDEEYNTTDSDDEEYDDEEEEYDDEEDDEEADDKDSLNGYIIPIII